jgi:hypothetical protein
MVARKGSIYLVALVSLSTLLISCTREVAEKSTSFSVTIPPLNKSSGFSAMSGTKDVSIVILNLRNGDNGPAKVFQREYHDGVTPPNDTQPIVMEISSNFPVSSNVMAQVLVVYEDKTSGVMSFGYASQRGIDTSTSSSTGFKNINLQLAAFGTGVTKEARIGGRYYTHTNGTDDFGPTGILYTSFVAPNPADPPITVMQSEIFNGWFSTFGLESGGGTNPVYFRYTVGKDDGTTYTMFPQEPNGLNIDRPIFNSDSTDRKIVRVNLPSTFERREGNSFEARAPTSYIAGYFADNTDVSGNGGETAMITPAKSACYPAGIQEVPFVYSTATGTPFSYSSAVHPVIAIGLEATQPTNYVTCRSDATVFSQAVNVYAGRLGEGREGVFGFRGPFAVVDDTKNHGDSYVRLSVAHNANASNNPGVKVEWKYLPDVLSSGAVKGVEVFIKYNGQYGSGWSGGGGDNFDEDFTCHSKAIQDGYVSMGVEEVAESMVVTAPVGHANFVYDHAENNSVYQWKFLVCPYRQYQGVRKYWYTSLESSCVGQCNGQQMFSFGRVPNSVAGVTVSTPTAFSNLGVGGATRRVTTVTLGSLTTQLTFPGGGSAATGFDIGDEVLIHVVASKGDGCGTEYTAYGVHTSPPANNARKYVFTKVVGKTAESIFVPAGSFVDAILATHLNVTVPGPPNWCFLQATKVLEFSNLTLDADVTADLFTPGNVSQANVGGIVAIRVSGVLDMNSSQITATGKGLAGGTSGSFGTGIGVDGAGGSYTLSSSAYTGGGGGAGASGQGGRAGSGNSAGGTTVSDINNLGGGGGSEFFRLAMGSGGGGIDTSYGGQSTQTGGRGGGIVFVAAKEIRTVAGQINANGGMVIPPPDGTAGAGGGGGGSIAVIAEKILNDAGTLPENLTLGAYGTDGAGHGTSNSSQVRGGGGGGGAIFGQRCNGQGGFTTYVDAGIVTGGNTGENGANNAMAGTAGQVNTNYPWYCKP